MKATALEFRFRLWIIVAVIALGFWAPWIEPLALGTRTTTWLWLGFQLSSLHITQTSGIVLVTWLAIALAAIGAWLRLWGTATLGTGTVNHGQLQAPGVAADGPYRYLRNPLYLGTTFMVAAIAVVMPPTGALFTLLFLGIFQFRLILAEEAFLSARLGEPYIAYLRAVPRYLPLLRTPIAKTPAQLHWGSAILSELMAVGTLISFATLSWQFNSELIQRALMVSLGASLIGRAMLPAKSEPDHLATGSPQNR